MVNVLLLAAAFVLLIGLLVGERRQSQKLVLLFKTPLSCLFVVFAVVQTHALAWYYQYVLVGLVLGLVGDVCLALPGKKAFRAGLVAFLAGHVLYVLAFAGLARSVDWITPAHLIVLGVSGVVFWWLRPHLGDMLIPVILYITVITAMVAAAWVAFRNPTLPPAGAWTLLVGAVVFYASDLFVARDRFVTHEFANRLIGLPLYYGGQFLIAASTGLVGSSAIS